MAVADEEAQARTDHNVRMLYREVAWAGVAAGAVGGFLSIFALRLGATPFEVGLLTTGPAVAGILFPLPAARVVSRMWGKGVVVLPLAIYRLLYAIMLAIPWLPPPSRVTVLVASVALLSIALAFFSTAWVPLLARVLSPDLRAQVVSVRGILAGLTSTGTVLVAGKILDLFPFPLNFQIIFGVALVTSQTSTWLVGRLHVPTLDEEPSPRTPVHGDAPGRPIAVQARRPWASPFWRHTGAATVLITGIYLPIAFYPILLVDTFHATNGWIGTLGTTGGLAGVGLSPLWGRASTRYGNRPILVASGLAYALVPLGASLAPTLLAFAPVAVAQAGLFAVVNQGLFQCLLDVVPLRRQTHFVALYSMIASGATAGAPLLGTYLLGTLGMASTFRLACASVTLGSVLLLLATLRSGEGMRSWRG